MYIPISVVLGSESVVARDRVQFMSYLAEIRSSLSKLCYIDRVYWFQVYWNYEIPIKFIEIIILSLNTIGPLIYGGQTETERERKSVNECMSSKSSWRAHKKKIPRVCVCMCGSMYVWMYVCMHRYQDLPRLQWLLKYLSWVQEFLCWIESPLSEFWSEWLGLSGLLKKSYLFAEFLSRNIS